MPLGYEDLEPVRSALRQMAWELDLERPTAPVPPEGEGVDTDRSREHPDETDIEVLNEIDDLTNLLADHAISTILLEANLGADLAVAASSGLIERARITFATDDGDPATYEPLNNADTEKRLDVTTRLLKNLATLRKDCGGVNLLRGGRESALYPPRLSPSTLRSAIDYLRTHSTLEEGPPMEAWHVNPKGWEAWL